MLILILNNNLLSIRNILDVVIPHKTCFYFPLVAPGGQWGSTDNTPASQRRLPLSVTNPLHHQALATIT